MPAKKCGHMEELSAQMSFFFAFSIEDKRSKDKFFLSEHTAQFEQGEVHGDQNAPYD